ncbi:MAG TPA: nucleotidyltransferase family protein [Blastocatellia bacterium]|jgi:hypothetical protein
MVFRQSRNDSIPPLSPLPFPAECELILCCAATVLDKERLNRIGSLLDAGLDWDYLVIEADRHGLMPLVYSNLGAAFPEAVPEPFINTLRDNFRKNAISNLLLTSEMCSIINLLGASGVSAVPFKGPTLAVAAYGDLALREFRDIDLLVREEDVLRARAILAARGYAPDHQLSRAQETAYLKSENECGLKGRVYLELQWNIVPRNHSFKLNDDELWRNLDLINVEGQQVAALSTEDLLLLLCVHASKQSWKRLSWVCDVSELIRARRDMDWNRLFERAKRLGGKRMLSTGLILANGLLGAALPDFALEQVNADRAARRLAARACARLFSSKVNFYEALKNPLFYIKARERLRDKARCCARMALSPTVNDLQSLSLPPALFFFYYPLRPLRLLSKYLLR